MHGTGEGHSKSSTENGKVSALGGGGRGTGGDR